jgi:cell division protein FtsB
MKWVTVLLMVALAALQYDFWWSKGGWQSSQNLQKQLALQEVRNAEQRDINDDLKAEIKDLQEGNEALAEIARDDLGYIQDGEVYYRFVPKGQGSQPKP